MLFPVLAPGATSWGGKTSGKPAIMHRAALGSAALWCGTSVSFPENTRHEKNNWADRDKLDHGIE
jgi:hypothetical protein